LAVKSFMAIWMQEHAIIRFISSSQASPDDVVTVPPCQFGDFSLAERAKAALLFPEVQ
jgi:hypothetical protein